MEDSNPDRGWVHISYITNKPLKRAVVYKHKKNFGFVVSDVEADVDPDHEETPDELPAA